MGSPAVPCSNSLSIWVITAGHFHIVGHQLASPFGHRVRIQLQKLGNLEVSAAAQFERLQAGIQSPLALVEQTGEQDNDRTQFAGSLGGPCRTGVHARFLEPHLPFQQLLPPLPTARSTVQEETRDKLASDPALPYQIAAAAP